MPFSVSSRKFETITVCNGLLRTFVSKPNLERASALGAEAIVAHSTPGGALARLAEERDLIRHWNPVLNQQHRTAG